jgi:DNA adenine methylase
MDNRRRKPIKPILRYYGGKWRLAPWIIEHLPEHRIYVEPFGGAASVLLLKDRSFSEVYNDLDGDIVNLFRVLQDQSSFDELHRRLRFTPFAREEYELAFVETNEPIEKARRLLVRSWQGFGTGSATSYQAGFRTNVKSQAAPARDWEKLIEHMGLFADRFMGVCIEHRPAEDVILGHDSTNTIFYVDPPYPLQTRNRPVYRHEMCEDEHRQLAECLRAAKGMVILSGYPCELYDSELYPDWWRVERHAQSEAHGSRTEVLWINPATQAALDHCNNPLGLQFSE